MEYLKFPSQLHCFINTETVPGTTRSGRRAFILKGELESAGEVHYCPCCGGRIRVNQSSNTELKDMSHGQMLNVVTFKAYKLNDETEMAAKITEISDICTETKNPCFEWFSRLLPNHFEGIIAHATYAISNGKLEGINNKIKTLCRQGCWYPDDEYFFLKLFDATRRAPMSHHKTHMV